MHQMNMWYNLQPETKQCLLIPPELRRARVVFFQHANASEMQTRAGYCRVGVFINSSKRESAWQALQPKGLGRQPIKHPALVHANSRTVLSFRSVIIAACFSPSVRLCVRSDTQHSPGTLRSAFADCTAALCCLLPPSESLTRLQSSATCCVYSLAAAPSFILAPAPQSCFQFYSFTRVLLASEYTLNVHLHIYVAAYYVLYKRCLWGTHKYGWL